MIYFGCWREYGHYLFGENLRSIDREQRYELSLAKIFPKCDGGFCPGMVGEGANQIYKVKQVEGEAALTHVAGWTVLAFWDRSQDTRGNSNSSFILKGTHDFDHMVKVAKEIFPALWKRFTFEVRLV